MFKLEPSSSVTLAICFLQVSPHLGYSVEWPKIEDNIGISRACDPCHDLSIFDFPLGIFILLFPFVRSRTATINMDPKVLTFDKYLELE